MFSFLKWLVFIAAACVLVGAAIHSECSDIVLEKTLEGFAAGLLVGLVIAISKLENRPFTLEGFIRLIQKEISAGMIGGLLLGLVIAVVVMLSA